MRKSVALKPTYAIPDLPPPGLIETPSVLRALARAIGSLLSSKVALQPFPIRAF
jgi:hypothetical protein